MDCFVASLLAMTKPLALANIAVKQFRPYVIASKAKKFRLYVIASVAKQFRLYVIASEAKQSTSYKSCWPTRKEVW
jgi:hypothetical protein